MSERSAESDVPRFDGESDMAAWERWDRGGDPRDPRPCLRCGETCTYDGWGHVHPNGVGIGSCVIPPAETRGGLVTALRTHITSLDGAPVIGCTLLAFTVLWAVCAVWAAGGRTSERKGRP